MFEKEQLEFAREVLRKDLDLTPYLTFQEISALKMRIERLLSSGVMPMPSSDWPAIPWPAF